MKNNKILFALIGILGFAPLFQACDNDDDSMSNYHTALVTVCPNDDGSFVLNLDDATVLYPANMKVSPFGKKEVRALVNYSEVPGEDAKAVVKNVQVNRIDSIRTKNPVMSLSDNDAAYGNDPIEIVQDWVTVAEDGYLTLRIRTLWGFNNQPHVLNLVTGVNPEDPFEMELRHNAMGDVGGHYGDALIAFNLNALPEMEGFVKIKLRWKSFSGEKSTEFNLKMRKDIPFTNSDNALCHKKIE